MDLKRPFERLLKAFTGLSKAFEEEPFKDPLELFQGLLHHILRAFQGIILSELTIIKLSRPEEDPGGKIEGRKTRPREG